MIIINKKVSSQSKSWLTSGCHFLPMHRSEWCNQLIETLNQCENSQIGITSSKCQSMSIVDLNVVWSGKETFFQTRKPRKTVYRAVPSFSSLMSETQKLDSVSFWSNRRKAPESSAPFSVGKGSGKEPSTK